MKGLYLQLAALLSAAQDPSWVSGDSASWTHQQWCRRSYFPLGCTSEQHLIWKDFFSHRFSFLTPPCTSLPSSSAEALEVQLLLNYKQLVL